MKVEAQAAVVPAVPEDVEESELVKRLVAPTAPTATDREEHTTSGHAVFRTWCRECCIGRQHRAGGRETTIPAIAIDNGYVHERDDLLQPRLLVSKCVIVGLAQPLCQQKGADEYAVAELKNDAICSGFTEVLITSDNEPAFLALKESAATALKLVSVNVKIEESALYDSQSNGLAASAVKDAKDAVTTNVACFVRRFGQEFPRGHPVLTWLVKYSVAMVNRCRRGQDVKTAYELRKGRKFARALPHFEEKILFMITGVTKGVARVEPRCEDGIFLVVSDRSDELFVGHRERHAQGSNSQTSRGHRTSRPHVPELSVSETLGRTQEGERRAMCVARCEFTCGDGRGGGDHETCTD